MLGPIAFFATVTIVAAASSRRIHALPRTNATISAPPPGCDLTAPETFTVTFTTGVGSFSVVANRSK